MTKNKEDYIIPFSYLIDAKDLVDQIDQKYPIKLIHNVDLVNRIHDRYNVLSKDKIALIVKNVFSNWRRLIIMGKILNFGIFNMKIHFHWQNNHPVIRLRLKTPESLRYGK